MAGLSGWLPRVALGAAVLGVTLAAAPAASDPGADPDDLLKGMMVVSPTDAGGRSCEPFFRGKTFDKWRIYASLAEEKNGSRPVIIPESPVQPAYPEDARQSRQEAHVILQAVILEDGTVEKLEPLESTGDCSFERAAIAAVKRWRYTPATLGGKPVSVYFTVVVDFKLETRAAHD